LIQNSKSAALFVRMSHIIKDTIFTHCHEVLISKFYRFTNSVNLLFDLSITKEKQMFNYSLLRRTTNKDYKVSQNIYFNLDLSSIKDLKKISNFIFVLSSIAFSFVQCNICYSFQNIFSKKKH